MGPEERFSQLHLSKMAGLLTPSADHWTQIVKFVWPTSGPQPCLGSGPILSGSPGPKLAHTLKTDTNNFLWPRCGRHPAKWLLFIDVAPIWPAYCRVTYYFMWPRHFKPVLAETWLDPRAKCGPETAKCNSAVKHKYNNLKRLKALIIKLPTNFI